LRIGRINGVRSTAAPPGIWTILSDALAKTVKEVAETSQKRPQFMAIFGDFWGLQAIFGPFQGHPFSRVEKQKRLGGDWRVA
jgi:hypothetical protein